MAEAWLLGQEPYLSSREMGQSVDEVEKLIKRHEAFEKSAATWEERFSALERLTTVSTEERNTSRPLHPHSRPIRSRAQTSVMEPRSFCVIIYIMCVCVCVFDQLELLEVRRQQEEEERMRKPATPEPRLLQEESQQQR